MILYALGAAWELHKPYFQKSGLLKRLVKEANEQSLVAEIMSDSDNETLEKQGIWIKELSVPRLGAMNSILTGAITLWQGVQASASPSRNTDPK